MRLILTCFCIALACPAFAQDRLTVGKCLEIANGLDQLDGYPRVIKDGEKETTVQQQYKLGSVRYTIALNMAALKPVRESAERARQQIIVDINGGKTVMPNSPEMVRFLAEYQKVLDKPCEVTPGHIKVSDLKLGDGPTENAVPPSVLSVLYPILDNN